MQPNATLRDHSIFDEKVHNFYQFSGDNFFYYDGLLHNINYPCQISQNEMDNQIFTVCMYIEYIASNSCCFYLPSLIKVTTQSTIRVRTKQSQTKQFQMAKYSQTTQSQTN